MYRRSRLGQILFTTLFVLSISLQGFQPAAAEDHGGVRTSRNPHTGKVSFIGASAARPINVHAAQAPGMAVRDRALKMVDAYASDFGLKQPDRELKLKNTEKLTGRSVTKFQQTYQDIPVMGGELIVDATDEGGLISMNGEISPDLSLDTQPSITAEQARETALQSMARAYQLNTAAFETSQPELWVYDSRLLEDDGTPPALVWRMQVTAVDQSQPIRELVLIDAQRGSLALHFNQDDTSWSSQPAPGPQASEPVAAAQIDVSAEPAAPGIVQPSPQQQGTGTTRYVVTTGTNAGDCSDSASPCETLNYAVSHSANGDTIKVASGTYTGTGTNPVVTISMSVLLSGGWNADFTAQDGASIIDGQNARRGMLISGSSTIDRFVVQHGYVEANYYNQGGAGVSIFPPGSSGPGPSVIIQNSAIIENRVHGDGGGIRITLSSLQLSNTTLSDNTATGMGAAVYARESSLTIQNSTIAHNASSWRGGGLFLTGTSGTALMENSILAVNTAPTLGPDCEGAITTSHHNIIGNTADCIVTAGTGDQFNVDPALSSTRLLGYLPLLPYSPAIDAADASDPSSCPPADQRGVSRPQGSACDIGAYEYTAPGPAAVVGVLSGSAQRAVPGAAFANPLVAYVVDAMGSPVPDVDVTFAAPDSGASAVFASTDSASMVTATDAGGKAVTSALAANEQLGEYAVVASVEGASPAEFRLTNQTWFVSPTGSDSLNSCTLPSSPCLTINGAIAKAFDGDRVYVASGVYTGSGSDPVVSITKLLSLHGGWNSGFTARTGASVIDGEYERQGIRINSSSSLDRFVVQHGYAWRGGGVMLYSGSVEATITNSTIRDNVAISTYAATGGGIDISAGKLVLINSTVGGNTVVGSGGGIYSSVGTVIIRNSTIAHNSATLHGGGIYSGIYSSSQILALSNTIVAGNTSGTDGPDCFGILSSADYSMLGSTANCTITAGLGNQLDANPQIGSGLIGPVGYYPLLSSSPAIDAADPDPAACPESDQRLMSRPQAGACDIGAYEYTVPGAAVFIGVSDAARQRNSPGVPARAFLSAYAVDSLGSPVSDVEIQFVAPSSGPSGTFAATGLKSDAVHTDAGGMAVASTFTPDEGLGNYVVSAQTAGLAPAVVALRNEYLYASLSGDDSNSCDVAEMPCLTINAAIANALPGEIIRVGVGLYTGSVVVVGKNVALSGGWDGTFASQLGQSIVDGQHIRRGIDFTSSGSMDHFIVQHALGGGLRVSTSGTVTVSNSTVRDNSSTSSGGGIDIDSGNLFLVNSTVGHNQAYYGGGVYLSAGSLMLQNSTIAFNSATAGGGLYRNAGSITIRNSIIANNSALTSGPDCYGAIAASGYSIIGNTAACAVTTGTGDKLDDDPQLSPALLSDKGYFALPASSLAIGAADVATCTATDQRGISRLSDGTCDIGAYEYASPGPAASFARASGWGQRTAPGSAFPSPLAAYVIDEMGNPVPGVDITFQAPASGAGAIFAANGDTTFIAPTDASGVAYAFIVASEEVGEYTVTATAPDTLGSVEFNIGNGHLFVKPAAAGGNDTYDCRTPATACSSLAGALSRAVDDDLILMQAGTYDTQSKTPVITSVTINGGWDGSFNSVTGRSIVPTEITLDSGVTASISDVNLQGLTNSGSLTVTNGEVMFIYQTGGESAFANILITRANWSTAPGIHLTGGRLSLVGSTITGLPGGAIYQSGGTLLVERSTISGNEAADGGGLHIYDGRASLENVTISGNTAGSGAGIYMHGGNLSINNSTITHNVATDLNGPGSGGGIRNINQSQITIANTILAGNAAQKGPDCVGSLTSRGHNLIGFASSCSLTIAAGDKTGRLGAPLNAMLGDLADNGGSTLTHALLDGSPAIDAGDPATCAAVDQRGVARPEGAVCDMGAFEGELSQTPSAVVRTYWFSDIFAMPGSLLCDQTEPDCTGGNWPHADAAHRYALQVYDFYLNAFGRRGLDGNNMPILSTVYADDEDRKPLDNAFWTGSQVVYGGAHGWPLADDVVGHELTHGVTQYSSGLFYIYQPGAINESLSDIFGELFDQTNGLGTDTPEVRWLTGEDISGLGAIRSLSDPPSFGDPDKITSSLYYIGDADNGGVHWNSGVGNKAAYLIADGGYFNGKTVNALGVDKTLAIYYEAQTHLLTPASDYADLYDGLYQACLNLVGGPAGVVDADCNSVRAAVDAVEMNKQPASRYNPEAPICSSGQSPLNAFFDDLESGTGKWAFVRQQGTQRWRLDLGSDTFAHSGQHALYADDTPADLADAWVQTKNAVKIPAHAYLRFAQSYNFEHYTGYDIWFDGGVLEYTANGGATWRDAIKDFPTINGYRGNIVSGTRNPLASRRAFVGTSHGYISTRLDLSSLKDRFVKFRWRIGLDYYGYGTGWWLDDVQIYSCSSFRKSSPADGSTGQTSTVTLSWQPVGGATSYDYCYDTTDDNACSAWIKHSTSTSASITGLSADTTYYWQVRAQTPAGEVYAGPNWWSFATGASSAAFGKLSPPNVAIDQSLTPLLEWAPSTGASGYEYCFDTNINSACDGRWASVTGTTAALPTLLPDTTYEWQARASNSFGAVDADDGLWFTLKTAPSLFVISGNATVPNALISFSGSTPDVAVNGSVFADAGGDYSFTIPTNWTGTVTPSKAGVAFSPADLGYTAVGADLPDQDYSAVLAFRSIAGNDAWVLESAETTDVGGSANSYATTLRVGDDAQDRQYRSIVSFGTATLPDDAIITDASLVLTRQSVTPLGSNPFLPLKGLMLDVRKGAFGSADWTFWEDFQAPATISGLGPFKPTPSAGVYTIHLPASLLPYVNREAKQYGVTQLRLRFKLDDNDNAAANYISFFSGEAKSATKQPALVITYHLP